MSPVRDGSKIISSTPKAPPVFIRPDHGVGADLQQLHIRPDLTVLCPVFDFFPYGFAVELVERAGFLLWVRDYVAAGATRQQKENDGNEERYGFHRMASAAERVEIDIIFLKTSGLSHVREQAAFSVSRDSVRDTAENQECALLEPFRTHYDHASHIVKSRTRKRSRGCQTAYEAVKRFSHHPSPIHRPPAFRSTCPRVYLPTTLIASGEVRADPEIVFC